MRHLGGRKGVVGEFTPVVVQSHRHVDRFLHLTFTIVVDYVYRFA